MDLTARPIARYAISPWRWLHRPNITVKASRFADRLELGSGVLSAAQVFAADLRVAIGGGWTRIGPVSASPTARRNISRAFPEFSETEIRAHRRRHVGNLGRVAAEIPHLRTFRVSNLAGGSRRTARTCGSGGRGGRRMIVFFGHIAIGNQDRHVGHPARISVAQSYRAGNNPLLERMIARFARCGELDPKARSPRGARSRRCARARI